MTSSTRGKIVAKHSVTDVRCRYCGSEDIWIEEREKVVANPIGSFSLSGVQRKVTAKVIIEFWMVCGGCAHESKGK